MENSNGQTFLDITRERWSVRKFKAEQISGEHMARILEAGRNAPSACNYQPQRVLVLQSDEAIAQIRAVTHWAFNAPTVLLVCADLAESWKNVDGCDSAEVDSAIALDHMMMEAWECGVGSTWVRGFDERVMRAAFDIPATWKIVAMMPMGYPAENARGAAVPRPCRGAWKSPSAAHVTSATVFSARASQARLRLSCSASGLKHRVGRAVGSETLTCSRRAMGGSRQSWHRSSPQVGARGLLRCPG